VKSSLRYIVESGCSRAVARKLESRPPDFRLTGNAGFGKPALTPDSEVQASGPPRLAAFSAFVTAFIMPAAAMPAPLVAPVREKAAGERHGRHEKSEC